MGNSVNPFSGLIEKQITSVQFKMKPIAYQDAIPSAKSSPQSQPLPPALMADLRTDQAGEVGAICIYQGILRFTRDDALRSFALRHLATETHHLQQIEAWLPPNQRSRLLPLWRLAGFMTGALPALFGPKAVYATVESVETFVNQHYEEQITGLTSQIDLRDLRNTLINCQADEIAHRDEAAMARGAGRTGWALRAWCNLVQAGSQYAVALCRHI